jgi:hypothetical protein
MIPSHRFARCDPLESSRFPKARTAIFFNKSRLAGQDPHAVGVPYIGFALLSLR